MGTRCNVIIKDEDSELIFYRHSDGYPECTGENLKEFVQLYTKGLLRNNVMQSAGWLIIHGHFDEDYKPKTSGQPDSDGFSGWKVGAYEPTSSLHGDVEYIYIIDLTEMTLTCRVPKGMGFFWDNPTLANTKACKEFKKVSFASTVKAAS